MSAPRTALDVRNEPPKRPARRYETRGGVIAA